MKPRSALIAEVDGSPGHCPFKKSSRSSFRPVCHSSFGAETQYSLDLVAPQSTRQYATYSAHRPTEYWKSPRPRNASTRRSDSALAMDAPTFADALVRDTFRGGFMSPTAARCTAAVTGTRGATDGMSYTRIQATSIEVGLVGVSPGNQSSWMVWCIGPGGWCD